MDRVMTIFVTQVRAKFQIHKIFKSQKLTDFLRFGPIFSDVKSIYTPECIQKISRANNNLKPLN